jgi:hypothetical protein
MPGWGQKSSIIGTQAAPKSSMNEYDQFLFLIFSAGGWREPQPLISVQTVLQFVVLNISAGVGSSCGVLI